jgi:hypothetical protein
MKKSLNVFIILFTSLLLLQCSTESIIEPSPAADDPVTTAASYADQFFTIGLTTLKLDPDDPLPALFNMHLSGIGGRVSINWGDGTIQKITLTEEGTGFSHQYQRFKNYTINVSGDIKNITAFDTVFPDIKFNSIHFGGLVNLRSVAINLSEYSPETINLSRNRMLESVYFIGCYRTKDILLPTTNAIKSIYISGENQLSTAVVDRIVSRVYDSVKKSPRSGSFELKQLWDQEDYSTEMVGPPSSYTLNKLRTLRDTYGWHVSPAF